MSNLPSIITTEKGAMLRIPLIIKKRGGRKEIFAPDGISLTGTPSSQRQEALVIAIARGFRWKKLLEQGKYATICELAQAIDKDPSQVMRILRLTLLAPDIIEAIYAGREPSGLSLERLYRQFPLLWEEQRKVLGFKPP